MKSTKAFAFVAALPWLAGLVLAVFGVHEYNTLFAPGRDRKKSDQAAVAAASTAGQAVTVDETAAKVKEAVAQSAAAHAAVIAQRDAIDDGVNGRVECAKAMLAADKEPTAAESAAQIMLGDAQAALGRKLTDDERAYWTKLAVPIIQKQQEALAEAQRQRGEAEKAIAARDALQAESTRKDGLLSAQSATLKEQSGQLVASATTTQKLTAEVKAWADHEPDLLARIKALGGVAVVLLVALGWYEIHRRGITGSLHDAVAAKEFVQTTAVSLGADAQKLKEESEEWWKDDPKGARLFAAIKAKLLI